MGTIDTSAQPIAYSGEGDVSRLDVNRLGAALQVAWMQDPRYDARIAGRFRVEGSGADSATMRLTGGGHLNRADVFHGTLSDAEVAVEILDGGSADRTPAGSRMSIPLLRSWTTGSKQT